MFTFQTQNVSSFSCAKIYAILVIQVTVLQVYSLLTTPTLVCLTVSCCVV
jgi:hypothetical protein